MKKELTKKQIIKRIFIILGIVLGCVAGIWIGYQFYILHFHFSLNNYLILIPEDVIADADYIIKNREEAMQRLEEPVSSQIGFFAMMPENIFKKLGKYMRENNLAIAPGRYELNRAWTFGMTKRALEFIPLEEYEAQLEPAPSG